MNGMMTTKLIVMQWLQSKGRKLQLKVVGLAGGHILFVGYMGSGISLSEVVLKPLGFSIASGLQAPATPRPRRHNNFMDDLPSRLT